MKKTSRSMPAGGMHPAAWIAAALIALIFGAAVLPGSARGAEQAPFDPQAFFPGNAVAFLELRSVEGMEQGLGTTPIGAMVSHPAVRAAMGRLPQTAAVKIREVTQEFAEFAGMDMLAALGLPRGRIAVAFYGMDDRGAPRFAAAIGIEKNREAILGLFEHLDGKIREAQGGGDLPTLDAGSRKAIVWKGNGGGPGMARAVLGTALVLAVPPEGIVEIARLYDGIGAAPADPGQAPKVLGDAPFLRVLKPALQLSAAEMLFALDLKGLRALLEPQMAESERRDVGRALRVVGIEGEASLGWAMGFNGGDFESRGALSVPGGMKGVLGAIASGIKPFEGIGDALSKMPAGTSAISSLGIDPGKIAGGILKAIREEFPEANEPLEEVFRQVETSTGISLDKDLQALPAIGMASYAIPTPAGALFEDGISLVRTAEFGPYEALQRKLAARSGGLKTLDAGDLKIHYGAFGAFMDLGDGWTAVAMTQALRRLSTHYSKGPQLTGDPALLKECREKLSGAGMSLFLRQGKDLLAAYNTVVALANLLAPYADEFLDPLGVDLALLPPGEEFLGLIRDGSLRMHFRPEGIRFHSHRLFTNTGWLAGIAAAGIAAGVAMPVFKGAQESGKKSSEREF